MACDRLLASDICKGKTSLIAETRQDPLKSEIHLKTETTSFPGYAFFQGSDYIQSRKLFTAGCLGAKRARADHVFERTVNKCADKSF
jgi:hypothetical protein